MVQWLRLRTANAGGLGSIPGQGTRSHIMPQLRACTPQLRSQQATTKEPWHNQINKVKKKKKGKKEIKGRKG